jgi:hypothetical protein
MLVTEKVFGFVIAAIAVQLILDGMVQMGGPCASPRAERYGGASGKSRTVLMSSGLRA